MVTEDMLYFAFRDDGQAKVSGFIYGPEFSLSFKFLMNGSEFSPPSKLAMSLFYLQSVCDKIPPQESISP